MRSPGMNSALSCSLKLIDTYIYQILVEVYIPRPTIKKAIVSANNHYAGFGPMTARMLR